MLTTLDHLADAAPNEHIRTSLEENSLAGSVSMHAVQDVPGGRR